MILGMNALPPLSTMVKTFYCLLSLFLAAPFLEAGEIFRETFTKASEGTVLTTLPKWSHSSEGSDTWIVTRKGLPSGAIEASTTGAYHRALSEMEVLLPKGGPYSLKAKLRFTEADAWADVRTRNRQG